MSIENNLQEIKRILGNMKNYDAEGFTKDLYYWVKDLEFFYNTLVEKQDSQDPSKTFYNIRPVSNRPKEGQIAYVNLRRGYPKETFGGHYCYILKDFGNKYVVIPSTSVKDESLPKEEFEIDIEVENFINNRKTRLHIDEIRAIDIQRIKPSKGVFNVKTDPNKILNQLKIIYC